MIRILLCCMGGFSSSAMIAKMKKDIPASEYADVLEVEFHPFSNAYEDMNGYDIMMCCPHLKYQVDSFIKAHHPNIPIYILPPRMYGGMTPKSLYEDACDVIEGYKKDHRNPWCFEGEENTLKIKRGVSHRESLGH